MQFKIFRIPAIPVADDNTATEEMNNEPLFTFSQSVGIRTAIDLNQKRHTLAFLHQRPCQRATRQVRRKT